MYVLDPWTATLEEELALPNNADGTISDVVMQCVFARGISNDRAAIENGSGFDVLHAVAQCARYRLAMPDWLAKAFLDRFRQVASHAVGSWDDPAAFGRPYPKGSHLARLRKDARAAPVIVFIVQKILAAEPETPIDEALFDRVAHGVRNTPGLGRSECQRIYYEATRDVAKFEISKEIAQNAAKAGGKGSRELRKNRG